MKKLALFLMVLALVGLVLPNAAVAYPKAKKPVIDIPIQQPLPVYVPPVPVPEYTLLYEFHTKAGWTPQTCMDHKTPVKQDMHRGFAQANGFGNLHKNVRAIDKIRPIVKNYEAKKGF